MSASYLVDLGGTCFLQPTFPAAIGAVGSGAFTDCFRSGILIGSTQDLLTCDSFCNVFVQGICVTSGPAVIQVQTSDSNTSGSFTDPTSGMPAGSLPTSFQSGGLLYIGLSGNGTPGLLNSGFVSGQSILSGFAAAAGFSRPQNGRYVRCNTLSGFFAGALNVSLISQQRNTGSGAGFTQSPAFSGTNSINV